MRFEIAVHAQRGCMRSDLAQQPTLDEKSQVVVDRGERNECNATPDRGVNGFWRMVSGGSDDGLIEPLDQQRESSVTEPHSRQICFAAANRSDQINSDNPVFAGISLC